MIVFLKFVFSLPGLLTVGIIWVVKTYPAGSAEIVVSTLHGIGAFFAEVARLLGKDPPEPVPAQ